MLVHRATISAVERLDFEEAIRACGKDPCAFSAELFECTPGEAGAVMRRVHVVSTGGAAQYEAGAQPSWTERFARHLALGVFG